mmetsp:Transcript_6839/g.27957  ORF Transcript_6839/g.27957 Transcript_6839/m.27957 type:complete len:227 (+) Transcript_6839:153-833(+)
MTGLRAEREGELGLAREFLSHEALALHLGDAKPLVHLGQVHAHHELVARDDGPPELHAVDPREEKLLLRPAFARRLGVEHDQAADLRHGLHHEHAGHDGALREVAGEEVVVDGDVLQADGVLALLNLEHAIDEQERVAVGEQLHDGVDVHLHGERLAQALRGAAHLGSLLLRGEARHVAASRELRGRGRRADASHGSGGRLGRAGRARGRDDGRGARGGGGEGEHI